ncbi:hypothetical protein VM57_03930 [Stenotrophomonas maltophilia]|uniref:Uncharacterized protein n=2 Tax=Pseudomonadota TaxID=1224 RepID=A0A0F5ZP81_STEMA|nr:hypothetical protein VM57_03930 [Stenotrophomonas maltophilia]
MRRSAFDAALRNARATTNRSVEIAAMLTRKLAITCLAAFLTSCAAHTSKVVPEQFLQPTVIEGTHSSLDAVMADPTTTTYDLYRFGGNAEDGLQRCNADKASALEVLKESNR